MADSVRVLYVADRVETAETAAMALEQEDPALAVETAGADEVADCLASSTDCVVVGSDLPEADGFGVLESVRAVDDTLPVVLVAGTDGEAVDAAVAAGFDATDSGEYAPLARAIRDAIGRPPGPPPADGERESATVPDVAFYIDETGKYVELVAGRGSPLLSDDAEALVGQHVADVVPADTADRVTGAVERALDTGEIQPIRYQLEVRAGARWFEGAVTPAGTTDDGRQQALLVARDITGQKERERALKALHEIATTIQAAETVERACELTVEAAADILDFEMCNVTIREGEWLVPYAMSEKAQPDGARTMHVEEGLAGKTFQTGESYVVDRVDPDDETSPTFDSIASGLSVPVGEHGVFQAVSTEPGAFDEGDITLAELLVSHTTTAIDRIERERTLTRKTERLEEFASFVSHDLRNPLNVAMLRLELASEDCNSEHLGELESALDRMERLIDELLALARQGDTIGDTEPVRLADVVRRAWEHVETAGATLNCRTDLAVFADRNRLTAVLENLVRNAVEHGGDGVTVTVGDLDDRTGFYIADDGPGIPEEERERVFESGYSTAADGTGFGLTIVRDIVEAHGWSVQATESETGGARFEISGVEPAD